MKIQTYSAIKSVANAFREIYEEVHLNVVVVFLEIAREEGLSVTQIIQRTGLSQASASRNCRGLTKWQTPTKEGLDLCEFHPCPVDFRSKLLYLNDKGRHLVSRLEEAMKHQVK